MPQSWDMGHYLTSPPKEGMLRIFIYGKIQRLRPGLNPRTWEPEASMQTTRPPKPLPTRIKQLESFRDFKQRLQLFLLDHPYSLNEFFNI
jgi:hypothetical protein